VNITPFRLGVIAPNASDATSWYRACGPLRHLRRHAMPHLDLQVFNNASPCWSAFMNVDAFFIQRPHMPGALAWAKEAASANVPLWIDYDDPVWAIPPHHPMFQDFHGSRKACAEILELASVITVSTGQLAENLKGRTQARVIVVPNAVDETFRPAAPTKDKPRHLLAWRGGVTHREDLELARPLLEHLGVAVQYFGVPPPWHNVDKGDVVWPWMATPTYLDQLAKSPAAALVVPLVDCPFNRAKSNCSWLEATWAGLATVHGTEVDNHTRLPEFTKPGILTLQQYLDGADLAAAREESLAFIRENLTLAQTNKLRKEVLESL
jgi:hypothetical protein